MLRDMGVQASLAASTDSSFGQIFRTYASSGGKRSVAVAQGFGERWPIHIEEDPKSINDPTPAWSAVPFFCVLSHQKNDFRQKISKF